MLALASVTQLRKELAGEGEDGVLLGSQSALSGGKLLEHRTPGKKRTDVDGGYAYIREPTHKETSGVMKSRGPFQESEKEFLLWVGGPGAGRHDRVRGK